MAKQPIRYNNGRVPDSRIGVPGFSEEKDVFGLVGRAGIGSTEFVSEYNLEVRGDLKATRIIDVDGSDGEFAYFLTRDIDGLRWVAAPPFDTNSIFIAEDGDILGVTSFTGINIISDQLLGISTNTINPNLADIRIDPRWMRDRTPGGGGGIYTTGTVGIGSTQPRLGAVGVLTDVKLDVIGDAIFSGIISASSFTGEFNVDTKDLTVSGVATFSGTEDNVLGDTNTGIVQIDGGVGIDKNVSIGGSFFVNSNVGIGTSTNLDSNALTIDGGDVKILGDTNTLRIGTAVTISNGIVSATKFDGRFLDIEELNVTGLSTFGDAARFNAGVDIFDDLFVSGNISVGGTGVTLDTETIRVEGKELLIGFTTTITPNDTTANAAGIAVASTEGFYLVDLQIPGINTTPNTYKQIKWFKTNTFVGQGTDAFISNQPLSIGNTQIQNGQLFAVGDNINFTEDKITTKELKVTGNAVIDKNTQTKDLKVTGIATINSGIVTNLNVSGIATLGTVKIGGGIVTSTTGTAVTYVGNLTGTASTASFATTAFTLNGRVESEFNVATAATATDVIGGIGSLTSLSVSGFSTFTGIGTFQSDLFVGGNVNIVGVLTAERLYSNVFGEFTGGSFVGDSIVGTALSISGISTLGTVEISSGIITATSGVVTYYGDGQYLENIIIGIGVQEEVDPVSYGATIIKFVGPAITVSDVDPNTGVATVTVNITESPSAGTANTATNIQNGTRGEIPYQTAPSTTAFISTAGISTGYVLSWDGDLPNWVKNGIGINSDGSSVGYGVTLLNFVGTGNTFAYDSIEDRVDIYINSATSASLSGYANSAGVSTSVIGGIGSLTSLSVSGLSTFTGIGTFQSDLFIGGDVNIVGVLTAERLYSNVFGEFTGGSFVGDSIVGTALSISGISTLGFTTVSNLYISGITTSDGGFVGNLTGTASTASFATTSFNLEDAANITTGTISSDRLTGSYDIDITGNAGTASTASFATTAFTLNDVVESDLNVAFAQTAGIATTATNLSDAANITTGTINSDRLTGSYDIDITGTATTATNLSDAANITTGTINSDRLSGSYDIDITGNAGSATSLETARNFEITGDVVASQISFDGTGNVSFAATIQPNSVTLGNDTTGDYVESISGTANEIEVTSGTGEGSTPTIGFVANPTIGGNVTIGQDLTVTRDLQVTRNLNVDGTITIGGTSATIFAETLKVSDSDLILGFRTDANGNDVSTDSTANHGGIAIASTEGSPLITLVNPGAGETLPSTYKKIMWFKAGSFAGLNTDAWLSNYAISIGSTQFPSGTRLAAGSVQITENDLAVVRNINASGIVTGTLANNLTLNTSGTGLSGVATYNNSGSTTFTVTSNATSNNTPSTIVSRDGSGNFSAGTITANLTGTATTATNLSDAANITTGTISSDRLTGSYDIDITGNAGTASTASFATTAFTLNGVVESDLNVAFAQTAGIATYTSEWTLGANGTSDYTFTGPGFTGAENDPTLYLTRGQQYKFTNNTGGHPFRIQSTPNGSVGTQYNDGITNNDAGDGTTLLWDVQFDSPDILYYQCTSHSSMGGKIYIVNAGIASDVNLFTTGIATIGNVEIGAGIIADGTIQLAPSESNEYVGIGTTNPTQKLDVNGNIRLRGALYDNLNGVGNAEQVLTSTGSGISWQDAAAAVSGVGIQSGGTTIGTGITTLNFIGAGNTFALNGDIVDISISAGTTRTVNTYTATAAQTTFSATYNVGYVDVFLNGAKLSENEYTATNGTSIVLDTGASLDDIVEVVGYSNINISGGSATPDISPVMMGMIF